MRKFVVLLLAAIVLGASTKASSEETPAPGWFLPLGINLGAAMSTSDTAFILGGEFSAVHIDGPFWAGMFTDGLHDFSQSSNRVTAGGELGWLFLGLELGYTAELKGSELLHGPRTGALLTNGFTSGYLRWTALNSTERTHIAEVGLLIKWPFMLSEVPE